MPTYVDITRISAEEKRLADQVLLKTGLRAYLNEEVRRMAQYPHVRHGIDATLKYVEEQYQEFRNQLLRCGQRTFTEASPLAKQLLRRGFCESYEGVKHVYRWRREPFEKMARPTTLREYLGDDGWIGLLITLWYGYQRQVFAKMELDDRPMPEDQLSEKLMSEPLFRSPFVMRLITETRAIKGPNEAPVYLRKSIETSSEIFHPNQKLMNMLIFRAYVGEQVPIKVKHWVGAWDQISAVQQSDKGRFGLRT